ncbi:unnamed protein product [Rotaria sordida]|uniref:RING-type domain-containing protein n=1 Tax=Rotaria sordida TaxID=392033 RepID=A0A814UKC6_9BILA|nr:unnamed protein product [Rotaria sordida]CAF1400650.1 unnamed protein product [Rotaria sordida]
MKCHKCSSVFQDPFQLACGHRQCRLCIDKQEGTRIKCIECNEETSREEKKIIKGLPVNAIKSNINKTTNDSSCVSSIVPSNRLSIQNSHSKVSIVNNVNTKQKQNQIHHQLIQQIIQH